MPEGDTIFRAARTLHRALTGRLVTQFDTQLSPLAVVDRRAPLAGRSILDVSARGKHLLMAFSGDLTLRSHMRMHGSWHIYRPGERWRAPRRDARIVITTDEWMAIAFSVTEAEFMTADELARHPRLRALGPDLLSPTFDANVARRRVREVPARHIAEALLRQQAVAGLGNVFKSELLFLCAVYPFTPVAEVADATLDCLLEQGRLLIRLNVDEPAPGVNPRPHAIAAGAARGRVTTGRLNPREALWVYGRAGEPCFRCAAPIQSATETEGRRTYWCPVCQLPRQG